MVRIKTFFYIIVFFLFQWLGLSVHAEEPDILFYKPSSLFEKPVYLDESDDWLIMGSDDHCNELRLHGVVDYHPDYFLNYQGLIVNLGRTASFINDRNNVFRSWLYKARPILDATILRDIHLYLAPDFGMSQTRLIDGLVDLNYFRLMSFRGGLQKSLVAGIEELTDVSAPSYQGFTSGLAPSREVGFLLYGAVGPQRAQTYEANLVPFGLNDWLSFQLGLFNGAPDASDPGFVPFGISPSFGGVSFQQSIFSSTAKALEARVFWNPFLACPDTLWQNLGFGLATSYQRVNNSQNLPDLLSLGGNPIFSYSYGVSDTLSKNPVYAQGLRTRIHPQFLWYKSRFGVVGDWTQTLQHLSLNEHTPTSPESMDDTIIAQKNTAAQIQLIYNLTGENFSLEGVTPDNNFKPGCWSTLGAFQFFVRLTNLVIDPKTLEYNRKTAFTYFNAYSSPFRSVQKASAYTLGLTWIWNNYFSMTSEFSHTKFVGGCSTGAFNDPYNPGCLTASAIYVYAPGSKVINRPDEVAFFQRMVFAF